MSNEWDANVQAISNILDRDRAEILRLSREADGLEAKLLALTKAAEQVIADTHFGTMAPTNGSMDKLREVLNEQRISA